MIMNRRNFEYRFKDAINYFVRCNPCRKLSSIKNANNMRDVYLNKGIKYLAEDLDIV